MNIEPDIFDYLETTSLEPHDDYTSEISYKDQKIIWNRLKAQQKEIERLNNIINECAEEILKELQENHHLSYGVALAIRQKLINYRELKDGDNNE